MLAGCCSGLRLRRCAKRLLKLIFSWSCALQAIINSVCQNFGCNQIAMENWYAALLLVREMTRMQHAKVSGIENSPEKANPKQMRKIDRTCLHFLAGVAFSVGVLMIVSRIWIYRYGFPFYPSGKILNDFGYFWGAARSFWLGRTLLIFHPVEFNAWLAAQLAPNSMEAFATWSYPPTMLLFLLPFGLVSPYLAMIIWDLLTFLFLYYMVRRIFESPKLALAVVLSPAALYCLLVEQNGALTAGLFIGALWLADHRPIVAGLCAAALVIKPQLAILVPFAFLGGGTGKASYQLPSHQSSSSYCL